MIEGRIYNKLRHLSRLLLFDFNLVTTSIMLIEKRTIISNKMDPGRVSQDMIRSRNIEHDLIWRREYEENRNAKSELLKHLEDETLAS